MRGRHCLKTWSSTQGAIDLSTAESELYSMIEGTVKAKGVKSVLVEQGLADEKCIIKLRVDSSAAKSFVSRRGFGRMRHLELRDLWIQKEVGDGKVSVSNVMGTKNPSDVGTKFLSVDEIKEKLALIGLRLTWTEAEVDKIK